MVDFVRQILNDFIGNDEEDDNENRHVFFATETGVDEEINGNPSYYLLSVFF